MTFFNSIENLNSALHKGETTCVAIVSAYLSRIVDHKNLNVFLEVWGDEALVKAKDIDDKISKGRAGKLAGVVFAIKDNICYKKHKVSASSKILEGFESLYSATVIEKLLAEDAIIIGRTNCDEFAMGASNENSAYGPVLNYADNSKVPGGSSGGSAVAVQAGLCHAALGSDTGGSIRQPAAFTGTVGFKPTYGMVSRYGLIAYASSFDQIGPITQCVADAALITEIMSGKDDYDATLHQAEKYDLSISEPVSKKRIAILKEVMEAEGMDERIKLAMLEQIEQLKKEGHEVEEVTFPYLDYLVPCYYVLTTAEASSNLSRFQGLQYGYRSESATDLESLFKKSRTEGFGKEVKRRIMLGTFVLSAGYFEAYYAKGQKVRRLIKEKTEAIFDQYDFILLPTSPSVAFALGEKSKNPIAMYLADIFCVQANIAGVPAISIPGKKTIDGLPFGLQLMAKRFNDRVLLRFADYMSGL